MNKIFFLLFCSILFGCDSAQKVDKVAEELIVRPTERAREQVSGAEKARLQMEAQQAQRASALDDIMNQ